MADAATAANKPLEDQPPLGGAAEAAGKGDKAGKGVGKGAAADKDPGRPWPDKESQAAAPFRTAPLAEGRCFLREHKDPGIWVCVERGTPYEALFDPTFWSSVARSKRFQPGQTIYAQNDETSWFAELKIVECGASWARVVEWNYQTVAEMAEKHAGRAGGGDARSQHRVEWGGAIDKFRILRLSDKTVIRTGFDTDLEANRYLDDHLRRVQR